LFGALPTEAQPIENPLVAQGGGQIMGQSAETFIGLLGRCPGKRTGINGGDPAVGVKLDPVAKGQKLPPQWSEVGLHLTVVS